MMRARRGAFVLVAAALAAGCMTGGGSNREDRALQFLDEAADKEISVLFLELRAEGQAQGPPVNAQRTDYWPPSYRWDSTNQTLWGLDVVTLWHAPRGGFLVIRSQELESTGWRQLRWWGVGQFVGTGTSFDWMDSQWTVRYAQPRFAQITGLGAGSASPTRILDAGSVHELNLTFEQREWWNSGTHKVELVEVEYQGTLKISNLGKVRYRLDPDVEEELRDNPSILRSMAEREAAKQRYKAGQPPAELFS